MRNIKTNPKLCQDDAAAGRAHAYRVALPALAEVKHLPLLRYESAESFRAIPLKIVLRWRFEPGADRLEIRAF